MVQIITRAAITAFLCLTSGALTAASPAPRLPPSIANGANDLQRAAWACEAGAPVLAPALATVKNGRARYFLSGAGEAGADEPPLILTAGKLTGVGLLSDDRGWSIIRFRCALGPDLRRATAFSASVLALAKAPVGDPTTIGPPADAAARPKKWNSDLQRASLSYGVPNTDDIDFRADCKPHEGRVTLRLSQTVRWLKRDGYVVVTLGDGTHSAMYVARGVLNEEAGVNMPEVSIAADDPLLAWLPSGKALLVNIGGDLAYSVPLTGAARSARAFAALCR